MIQDVLLLIGERLALSTINTLEMLGVLLLPVVFACIPLHLLRRFMQDTVGRVFGWPGVVAFGLIGTPVHEFSHLAPLVLTGHQIERIALFEPHQAEGILGYVIYRRDESSLLQQIGGVLSSYAPLVGGAVALFTLTRLFYPGFALHPSAAPDLPLFDLDIAFSPARYLSFLEDLAHYIIAIVRDLAAQIDFADWHTWLYGYVAFSISQNLSPSQIDIASSWAPAGLILIFLILLNAVVLFFSDVSVELLALLAKPIAVLVGLLYFALALAGVGALVALGLGLIGGLFRTTAA